MSGISTCGLLCFLLSLHCLLYSGTCLKRQPAKGEDPVLPDGKKNIDWPCSSDEECSARGSKCIGLKCQCSAGYIFSSDMTSCLKGTAERRGEERREMVGGLIMAFSSNFSTGGTVAGTFGDQCTEDIQCSRYLFSGGRCINNGCRCAKGYYYMHGRCNPHSELFGRCEKEGDCYVHADFEASGCDEGGICRCSPGYYQREYRTCRRSSKEFGDFCTVNADCHFDEEAYCNDELKCAKEEGYLGAKTPSETGGTTAERLEENVGILVGDKCEKDEECESLGGAECTSDGICACKRAHFPAKKKERCVPELGEACQEGDPEWIKNSVCRNKRWACKGNVVVSRDRQKCRKASRLVGDSCLEDEQCSALGPDAYCDSRKCACYGNSHYVESEEFCWINKAYGEACQRDFDCYVNGFSGTLYCVNSACSCPNGTRLHSNGLECVTSSADIGMRCETTSDCIAENALCINDLCLCPDNHYEMDKECWPGVNATCTSEGECTPEHSVCLSGKCDCEEGFVASSTNSCLPVVNYGKACLENVQCDAATANSNCVAVKDAGKSESAEGDESSGRTGSKKVCRCIDGYYLKSAGCFRKRLLGEACRSRDDCYLVSDIELAICLNGFCACSWGYAPENLTHCNKARDIQPYDNSAFGLVAGSPSKLAPLILLPVAYSFSW